MTEPVLHLEKAQGFLRKISINVLNKNADYTLFTLPIEGIPLSEQQLDAFMGQYTFRSWYEQRTDNSWHPMPWWGKRDNGDFQLDGRFECETAVLTIEGKDFKFEQYNADEEGEDDDDQGDDVRPGARLSSIVLKPTPGGVTLLSFHLQVRPEIGKVSNALLEHMFRHIAVTFEKATVVGKNGKQQSLPLVDQSGHQSPPPIVSKGGEALDQAHHASHPEGAAEVMGADKPPEEGATSSAAVDAGGMDPQLEADTKKFEQDAQARIDEFNSRAANRPVDGTTMRSRRRRGDGDDATH